jgi:hypothetical protein
LECLEVPNFIFSTSLEILKNFELIEEVEHNSFPRTVTVHLTSKGSLVAQKVVEIEEFLNK